jgi:hypothetical protein
LPLISHTVSNAKVPTVKEISAASTAEPPALASIALVGAWIATIAPAMKTRRMGMRTAKVRLLLARAD